LTFRDLPNVSDDFPPSPEEVQFLPGLYFVLDKYVGGAAVGILERQPRRHGLGGRFRLGPDPCATAVPPKKTDLYPDDFVGWVLPKLSLDAINRDHGSLNRSQMIRRPLVRMDEDRVAYRDSPIVFDCRRHFVGSFLRMKKRPAAGRAFSVQPTLTFVLAGRGALVDDLLGNQRSERRWVTEAGLCAAKLHDAVVERSPRTA
jgi:hypothetical protein